MSHGRRRRSAKRFVAADLELLPLMNLFIVLIPLLLLSAVFVQVAVIDMRLPTAAASAASEPATEITIRITDAAWIVGGTGLAPRALARTGAGLTRVAAAAELRRALEDVVAAHPGAAEVRIVAGATTRYEDVVAVMDIARAAGLPEAALAEAAHEGA